jgi:hypothetical protein
MDRLINKSNLLLRIIWHSKHTGTYISLTLTIGHVVLLSHLRHKQTSSNEKKS